MGLGGKLPNDFVACGKIAGLGFASTGGFALHEDLGLRFGFTFGFLEWVIGVHASELRFGFRRNSVATLSSPAGWQ